MPTQRDDTVENRLDEIEAALRGDMAGKPGIMQTLLRLMEDVYKPPTGLSGRVGGLEEWKIRKEERVAGAAWVMKGLLVAVGGIIGIVAGPIIKKLFGI